MPARTLSLIPRAELKAGGHLLQGRRAIFIPTSKIKEGMLSTRTVRHNGRVCKGSAETTARRDGPQVAVFQVEIDI